MDKRKKYFPNRWRVIKDTPVECFESHDAREVIELNWDLAPGYLALIRATNHETGKISEYCYKRQADFAKRIESLIEDHELAIVLEDGLYLNLNSNNDFIQP